MIAVGRESLIIHDDVKCVRFTRSDFGPEYGPYRMRTYVELSRARRKTKRANNSSSPAMTSRIGEQLMEHLRVASRVSAARWRHLRRGPALGEPPMSLETLLIIVLVVMLVGGGGFYGRGRWY